MRLKERTENFTFILIIENKKTGVMVLTSSKDLLLVGVVLVVGSMQIQSLNVLYYSIFNRSFGYFSSILKRVW